MMTERLIIRFIEPNDYDDICEYGCDEDTGKHMIYWPKTEDQIKELIDKGINAINSTNVNCYEFVIQLKDNRKVIGNISLEIKGLEAEIGWISNKNYWNNGYMSEAVNAVINYTFQTLGIHKIFATCSDKNIASYRIMEKCNMIQMKLEKNHRSLRHGVEVRYNKLTYCIEK